MRALAVEGLKIRGFRNLRQTELALGPGLNVVQGDNGHGKTNLLEALYVAATSRSFRTARVLDVVQVGADAASVRAQVREAEDTREQNVGVQNGRRMAFVDGKRVQRLADYAVQTPVVAFHPGALVLSSGASSERRKLLDRVALYRRPESLADAADYTRASRARQRLLEVGGEGARGLDEWEELMVTHGLRLSHAREEAAGELGAAAEESHAAIGPAGLKLDVRYEPGAPRDAEPFRSALALGRRKDRARGSAGVGPHRDDVVLRLGEKLVRTMASQGQHRAVVLALELGEMAVIGRARGAQPISVAR